MPCYFGRRGRAALLARPQRFHLVEGQPGILRYQIGREAPRQHPPCNEGDALSFALCHAPGLSAPRKVFSTHRHAWSPPPCRLHYSKARPCGLAIEKRYRLITTRQEGNVPFTVDIRGFPKGQGDTGGTLSSSEPLISPFSSRETHAAAFFILA